MIDIVIQIIEIIGVVSFCMSGAIVAIDKEMDLMGVVLIALTTTFGGGIFRDLVLDRPVAFFFDGMMHVYVLVGTVTAILVFILASAFKKWYVKEEEKVNYFNNYVDAMGLGAFTVTSVNICINAGVNAFLAIAMGMIASVGGGVVRDLFLDRVPNIFRKHIYALACLIGSALYYCLRVYVFTDNEIGEVVSTVICIITVFTIRVLASTFKWNLPKAIRFSELEKQ